MDRAEILNEMIAEKRRLIELYEAMVAEWEKELGVVVSHTPGSSQPAAKKLEKPIDGDLLSVVREWEFFNKSQPEAAKAFLEKLNHPAKTQIILDAIAKGGVTVGGKTDKDKKQNLYTILYRSPDFGLVAKAKDTWGLIGWQGVAKKEAKDGNGDAAEKNEKEEIQK